MLIGLAGRAKVGKDTVAEILLNSFYEVNHTCQIHRFSDKLKEIAEILTGEPIETFTTQEGKEKWLEDWNMTARDWLMRFGTDGVRNGFDQGTWVLALLIEYHNNNDGSIWIIPDVRFPNEYAMIKNEGGIVIHIERPDVEKIDHESETSLDGLQWDYEIINRGTLKELQRRTEWIAQNIASQNLV